MGLLLGLQHFFGEGYHPQTRAGALAATDYGAAAAPDGAVDLVKVTVHPALHIVTTESNECDARLGITWVAQAVAGRSGKLRVQV
jgi:hypothetical protein